MAWKRHPRQRFRSQPGVKRSPPRGRPCADRMKPAGSVTLSNVPAPPRPRPSEPMLAPPGVVRVGSFDAPGAAQSPVLATWNPSRATKRVWEYSREEMAAKVPVWGLGAISGAKLPWLSAR